MGARASPVDPSDPCFSVSVPIQKQESIAIRLWLQLKSLIASLSLADDTLYPKYEPALATRDQLLPMKSNLYGHINK